MNRFERKAWTVAAVIILAWCLIFGAWLMLAPYPAILYP